jgi:hypothetical protein
MSLAINSHKNSGKFFSTKYCFLKHRRFFRNPASGHRSRHRHVINSQKRTITAKLVRIFSIILIFIPNKTEKEEDDDDSSSCCMNTTLKK